jgi:hypothetical protein
VRLEYVEIPRSRVESNHDEQAHAVTRPDDLADVGGAPGRGLEAQADGLVEEGRIEARRSPVRARLVAQPREPV